MSEEKEPCESKEKVARIQLRMVAVTVSALAAITCMYVTNSSTGIGWFIVSLFFIF